MAKPDTSRIDTLEAIMAEKRKHESYLAKLQDRRESTPAHVFNRLRDEYLTKLTDLQVRAQMEAESLSEGLKADEVAVEEIEAKLAAVTEERIEGELRAEVGEYDPKEWAKKLDSLNSTIAQIEKDRTAKVTAFERTRALLIEARGAASPPEVPPAAVVPPPTVAPSPAPSPPAPPPAKVEGSPAPAPAPVAAPSQPSAAAAAAAAAATAATAATAAAAAAVAAAAAAGAAPAVPAPTTEQPPAPAPPAAPPRSSTPAPAPIVERPSAPAPKPMTGGPSFDELAFLNSVVGRNSAQAKAEPAPPESRPSGASRAMPTPSPVSPPAPPAPPAPRPSTSARAPAGTDEEPNSGPLGRPTPRTSQAIKTLKCQECGTLNFPTEWYCERCGGELAAL